jgi:Na+/melibiose symporter-like transporter
MNDNWLDEWIDSMGETMRRWGRRLFLYGPILVYVAAAAVWCQITADGPLKATYWVIQTATTVGYGTGWSEFNCPQLWMCILTMLTLGTYWSCLLSLLGNRVAAWIAD